MKLSTVTTPLVYMSWLAAITLAVTNLLNLTAVSWLFIAILFCWMFAIAIGCLVVAAIAVITMASAAAAVTKNKREKFNIYRAGGCSSVNN